MLKEKDINQIFEETKTGYSFDRYGENGWKKSIENLASLGYTKKQIIEVMLSKLTRWAGDAFAPTKINSDGDKEDDWGNFTGDEIVKYHKKFSNGYKLKP